MTGLHPLTVCRDVLGIDVACVLPGDFVYRAMALAYVGDAPTGTHAMLDHDGRGIVMARRWPRTPIDWPSIVHEALHLVLGERSLATELEMMPVEHAVWSTVRPRYRSVWRDSFAHYGFDWNSRGRRHLDIGPDDAVFHSRAWRAATTAAHDLGWLHGGRLVLRGVHPSLWNDA